METVPIGIKFLTFKVFPAFNAVFQMDDFYRAIASLQGVVDEESIVWIVF